MAKEMIEYDYSRLPSEELSGELRRIESAVRELSTVGMVAAVKQGGLLQAARDALERENAEECFGAWVDRACDFSRRSAYRYMGLYEVFGEVDPDVIKQFSLRAMEELSRDVTPEGAIGSALRVAKKGDRVTERAAKAIVERFTLKEAKAGYAEVYEEIEEEEEYEPESETEEVFEPSSHPPMEPELYDEELYKEASKALLVFVRKLEAASPNLHDIYRNTLLNIHEALKVQ